MSFVKKAKMKNFENLSPDVFAGSCLHRMFLGTTFLFGFLGYLALQGSLIGYPTSILESLPTVPTRKISKVTTNFPNRSYQVKSTPAFVPGGSIRMEGTYFTFVGNECQGLTCDDKPPHQPDNIVNLEGDIIAAFMHPIYLTFMVDTIYRLWPLRLHGVFEKYPNATILWLIPHIVPRDYNIEMMNIIWPDFPMHTAIVAKENATYKVDDLHTLIVPRYNSYHGIDKNTWTGYNFWLLDNIRENFDIIKKPTDDIFISRRGHPRQIELESELYKTLKSFVLPNLKLVLPDDFSVAEQMSLFANAKVIIATHGGSLINTIFSNWDEVTLFEFTTKKTDSNSSYFPTFRSDLQVKHHYLLKCQSLPCTRSPKKCNPWQMPIDVNVSNATRTVKDILAGKHLTENDFFISTR